MCNASAVAAPEAVAAAREANLRYVSDESPGNHAPDHAKGATYARSEWSHGERPRNPRPDQAARDSSGVDGCVDLSAGQWTHSSDRPGCAGQEAVPLSLGLVSGAGWREVRTHDRVRKKAAAYPATRSAGSGAQEARSPESARCDGSTAGDDAGAESETKSTRSRTARLV